MAVLPPPPGGPPTRSGGESQPPEGDYPPPPPGGDPWSARSPSGPWLSPPKGAYTPWSTRVVAFLIDWAPIGIPLFALASLMALIERNAEDFHFEDEGNVAVIVWLVTSSIYFFWNFCYRQGTTGQSIGKSVMKFKVISEQTWQPIGFWRSFLRQLAHYLDNFICSIGFFWPLWDDKRQTFADKIMKTVCVPLTPSPIIPSYAEAAQWQARGSQDAEIRRIGPEEPSAFQPRWFSRFSPQVQGWISAALLAPPLLVKAFMTEVVRSSVTREEWGIAWDAYTVAYGLYFLAVIAMVTRDRARLAPALCVAGAVVFLDIVLTLGLAMSRVGSFVAFSGVVMGYVAAWGIARRQHKQWLWGLLLSALVCTAFRFLFYSSPIGGALYLMGKWELTFLMGCLICLAFDVVARRRMIKARIPQ
ncbi:MAG: RDD family protein [Mycolicibacterium sp.]|uniref:RDD family protein n=1 Tax=Mycolicibacterium sp. TaxID=2320850 RepID=UPI003D106AB2